MSEPRYVTEFKQWRDAETPEQQLKIAAEQVRSKIRLTPNSNSRADTAPNGKPLGQCTGEESREFSNWYSMLTGAAQKQSEEYGERAEEYDQWFRRMRGDA